MQIIVTCAAICSILLSMCVFVLFLKLVILEIANYKNNRKEKARDQIRMLQQASTLVKTEGGWKRIDQIKPGDLVYTQEKSALKKVLERK